MTTKCSRQDSTKLITSRERERRLIRTSWSSCTARDNQVHINSLSPSIFGKWKHYAVNEWPPLYPRIQLSPSCPVTISHPFSLLSTQFVSPTLLVCSSVPLPPLRSLFLILSHTYRATLSQYSSYILNSPFRATLLESGQLFNQPQGKTMHFQLPNPGYNQAAVLYKKKKRGRVKLIHSQVLQKNLRELTQRERERGWEG